MTLDELAPMIGYVGESLDRLTEVTFAVGVLLAAWFLYSLFWRK